VDEYRRELGPKVDKIKQIMKLYREFDSKKEEKGIKTGDRDDPEDPIEFLISRRFATGFRKRVMNQLKRISSVDAGLFSPNSDAKSEGYLAECILEGIDAMSTDELDGMFTHGNEPVDALVNTNIICEFIWSTLSYLSTNQITAREAHLVLHLFYQVTTGDSTYTRNKNICAATTALGHW